MIRPPPMLSGVEVNVGQMLTEVLSLLPGVPGLAVIINDSAGRAWRNGTVGFAIGSAGIEPLRNQVGEPDLYGRALEVTEVALVDELAAAASFVMGQAAEACPVVVVRGASWQAAETGSRSLLRDPGLDMFR